MVLRIVEKYIDHNKLLDNGESVIVGVSGGADSVALLDILYRLGYRCIIGHCNFHLRDAESDRDALFVEELSHKYGFTFNKIDFDTKRYAAEQSISIEMAARDLRYRWFEELRMKYAASAICVAHHRDDSVETILLNLIRGTGIRGLTGISPRNGHVIRPLLDVSRSDILDYLKQYQLSFVEDSSNSEDLYTRNKIRLNIIPLIESINPSAKEAIHKTASHLVQTERIYRTYIEEAKNDIMINNRISIARLMIKEEPEAVLYEILYPYGYNSATVNQIFDTLDTQSGKIFLSDTHELLKDREYLIIRERHKTDETFFSIAETDETLPYPIHLTIKKENIDNDHFEIERNRDIAYIDSQNISYPLIVRRWQQGDWFIPFGMKGKKKVSDYFTDIKLSLFEKENTWLLCSGKDIIWVIGHRADNRYRITDTTKEILKIKLRREML